MGPGALEQRVIAGSARVRAVLRRGRSRARDRAATLLGSMPPEALPWIALALLAAVVAGTATLAVLLARLAAKERASGNDAQLAEIAATLKSIASAQTGLDLRRLEHVLIDLRDGQKRVEDRLLATLEARSSGGASSTALEPVSGALANSLSERIVTRLLALGYERIQFVTPVSDVQKFSAADGDVLVEARRDGAACKGRVLVRSGTIADLQIQSAYSIFP